MRLLWGIVLLGALAAPAGASDPVLDTFRRLLDDPQVLRLDVAPGPGEGRYVRINVYAGRGKLAGLPVEDLWMLITEVVVDRDLLAEGRIRITSYDDAAIHAFVLPEGLAQAFRRGTVKDARVALDGDVLVATGTYPFLGIPSKLNVRGRLVATGRPEVVFKIERLVVGAVPMPGVVVAKVERDINPIVSMRKWPVQFPINSVRVARAGLLLSSLKDATAACGWCLTPR